MTRRVLLVTSSYEPTMIADMHRARQLAWELPSAGWDVEVLAPDRTYQPPSCLDTDSDDFFAREVTTTHFAKQYLPSLFRLLRIGTIGWRALLPMLFKGAWVLRQRRFDLVYITTAQFPLFMLGPVWRLLFGVPFVLDIHDPCHKEGSSTPAWAEPSLKHALSRRLMKRVESICVRRAAGLVSVSPEYRDTLKRRYGDDDVQWLAPNCNAVVPFSLLPRDFAVVSRDRPSALTSRGEGPARIIYVGAGGPVMLRSFGVVCAALAHLLELDDALRQRFRLELYGTTLGWREGGPKHLLECAGHSGVADLVIERPGRISYRRSIELLLECDGALILGVDDAGYMPSKLFPYVFSGKPLLASVRRDGPAYDYFQRQHGLEHALWFDAKEDMPIADAAQTMSQFLLEVAGHGTFDRRDVLEFCTAAAMARKHSELFDACIGPTARGTVVASTHENRVSAR